MDVGSVAGEEFIYLTTRGRKTGKPHMVELDYAAVIYPTQAKNASLEKDDRHMNARKSSTDEQLVDAQKTKKTEKTGAFGFFGSQRSHRDDLRIAGYRVRPKLPREENLMRLP